MLTPPEMARGSNIAIPSSSVRLIGGAAGLATAIFACSLMQDGGMLLLLLLLYLVGLSFVMNALLRPIN